MLKWVVLFVLSVRVPEESSSRTLVCARVPPSCAPSISPSVPVTFAESSRRLSTTPVVAPPSPRSSSVIPTDTRCALRPSLPLRVPTP
ncbi:hypothetical protein BGZ75_010137, partial [Mortierella antarctica]